MNKFVRAGLFILAAALVLSPAVLSAQAGLPKGGGIDKQPVGDIQTIPADSRSLDAIAGIQKTVNLSPFAFVADPYQHDVFYSYIGGYLRGGDGGYSECFGNLTFPKGAKKIVAVYWLVHTAAASDCYVAIYRNTWSTSNPSPLTGGYNSLTGWQLLAWSPPKPSWPVINPTDTFFIEFYATSNAQLKGVAVVYK